MYLPYNPGCPQTAAFMLYIGGVACYAVSLRVGTLSYHPQALPKFNLPLILKITLIIKTHEVKLLSFSKLNILETHVTSSGPLCLEQLVWHLFYSLLHNCGVPPICSQSPRLFSFLTRIPSFLPVLM